MITPALAARLLNSIHRDVGALRADLLRALDHIEQSMGGYPSAASGSDPGGGSGPVLHVDGDAIPMTGPEAAVLEPKNDPAERAMRRVARLLPRVHRDLTELAKLVDAWTPQDDIESGRWHKAAEELTDDITCPNHQAHGVFEVRAKGRKLCRWCDDVKRDTKSPKHPDGVPPDSELIEARRRWGRTRAVDYQAFCKRHKVIQKKAAKK